jgi:hypothetical protein
MRIWCIKIGIVLVLHFSSSEEVEDANSPLPFKRKKTKIKKPASLHDTSVYQI